MSSCLICGGVASPTAAATVTNSGIDKICLFHKILEIPLSTCWTWLEEEEGVSFCGGCNTLVEQGISLVRLLDSLETQLKGVQFKLSALLLNQHHLNENEGGEDKSLRFSLIGEIKGRLKFNEALVKGNFGQTETDQGQVLEEEDELSDGIGIITETTSMSTAYLGQNGGVQDSGEGGDQISQAVANFSSESQQQLEIEGGADPLGEEYQGEYSNLILDEEAEIDPLAVNMNLGTDSEEFYIHDHGNVEDDYGQDDDEGLEDESYQQLSSKKCSTEVSASFLSFYAELDAQKHSNNPNRVKVAPSSTTTSTPENVAAIKLTPSPRVIQTPLRLRDSSSSSSLTNSQKRGYVPRNWLCVLCNHKCDSAQELGHHYSSFHGNPSDWKCFVCKKNFDKKEKLYLHRREVHKNLPINSVMKKRQVSSNLDEGKPAKKLCAATDSSYSSSPRKIQAPLRLREEVTPSWRQISVSTHKNGIIAKKPKLPLFPRRYVTRNWLCVLCNRKCGTAQELGQHYSTFHGNPTNWECFVCQRSFDKKEKLYLHRRDVHRNLPINSVYKTGRRPQGGGVTKIQEGEIPNKALDKTFPSIPKKKQSPIRIREEEPPSKIHVSVPKVRLLVKKPKLVLQRKYVPRHWFCVLCNKTCATAPELGHHYSNFHGNPTNWECLTCGRSFDKKEKLYVHRRELHKNLPINSVTKNTGKSNGEDVAGSKDPSKIASVSGRRHRYFFCVLCDQQFSGAVGLGSHYSTAHGQNPVWRCGKCGEVFENQPKLYFHRKDVHKNLPVNKKSKVGRPRNENVKPAEIRPVAVPVTPVSGSSPLHKNFFCLLCDQDFPGAIPLGIHYTSAHGKNPIWSCNKSDCAQIFTTRPQLYIHRRLVHKNLPINATLPEKKIERNSTQEKLETNIREIDVPKSKPAAAPSPSIQRNFFCVLCDHNFGQSFKLGAHYASAHGKNPIWKCSSCSVVFETQKKLYFHRRDVHKNLPINKKVSLAPKFGLKKKKPILTSSVTSSGKRNSYVCLLCDKDCQHNLKIQKHYAKCHPNTTEWPCLSCSKVFRNKNTLYCHRRDAHQNIPVHGNVKAIKNSKQEAEPMQNKAIPDLRRCLHQILTKLRKDERFAEFSVPVNLEQVPDYLDIISEPMDFQTMTHNLDSGLYPSTKEFLTDIDLISENCVEYNPLEGEYNKGLHTRAIELKTVARKLVEPEIQQVKNSPNNEARTARTHVKAKSGLTLKKKTFTKPNFACVICGVDCLSGVGVSVHYRKEHPTLSKNLKCPKCSRTFNSYNTFFTHKRHYHKEDTNQNQETAKSPPNLSPSKSHAPPGTPRLTQQNDLTPGRARRFICLICDQDCENLHKISKHYKLLHPDTSNWPCSACDRVFTKKNSLYAHRRDVHKNLPVGTRPASVKPRPKFKTKLDKVKVTQDKVARTPNFACVICGVDCKSGVGVKWHYVRDHPTLSKNLKCSKCSRVFQSYNSFFSHKRYAHKILFKTEDSPEVVHDVSD